MVAIRSARAGKTVLWFGHRLACLSILQGSQTTASAERALLRGYGKQRKLACPRLESHFCAEGQTAKGERLIQVEHGAIANSLDVVAIVDRVEPRAEQVAGGEA